MVTYNMLKSLQSFFDDVENLGFSVVFGSKELGVLNVRILGSGKNMKKLREIFNIFLDDFDENYYVDFYWFNMDNLYFKYVSRGR